MKRAPGRGAVLGLPTMTLALVLSACGTTVPVADRQGQLQQGGTSGADGALTGTSAGTTGSTAPGSVGGTTGSVAGHRGGATGTATGSTSGTTGGTVAPGSSGGSTGGTGAAVTSPLKVGVTYIDNDGTSQALGVSDDSTVNGRSVMRSLVRGINTAGGLAGRTLQPVEYSWNSQSSSWSTDATEACQLFTRDNKVDVVLDNAFGTTGGFGQCLQKAGVLQLVRGPEGDRVASVQAGLHANTGVMVYDRAYTAVLRELAATGYLGRTRQLGILVEDCPAISRAYDTTLRPLITRLGLAAPVMRTFGCTTSFASAGPAASAISNAVLAFRSSGVDRVMFVSDYEDVALLLFSTSADSQGYRPGYALSSGAQASIFEGNLPEGQWPQLHGVGSIPGQDVTSDSTAPTAVEARCLALARSGGLRPANASDRSFVHTACGLALLLEAALSRTRGDADPRRLQDAINGLGSTFVAPGLVAGRTRFGSRLHDGPNAVRVFAFVPSCTCIRYAGPVLAAPS